MDGSVDARDKVYHLSPINSDENLDNNQFGNILETEEAKFSEHNKEGKVEDDELTENYDHQDSTVKIQIYKPENQDFAGGDINEPKKQLFSGPDSLLREIISRTPRDSSQDFTKKHKTKSHNYDKSHLSKSENSDAATKKRVDISNLGNSLTPNSSSSQIFTNQSFQKFSRLQFNSLMEHKDQEIPLQKSEKNKTKCIDKVTGKQKYSPIINRQKGEQERWVSQEKEEVRRSKKLIDKWNQTKVMLEQTEQNARLVRRQIASLD
jgi:hypothetical protein